MTRRVVVTGMGLVTPLGRGIKANWEKILAGTSAIQKVTTFDVSEYPCKIAGAVPVGTNEGEFDPDTVMPLKDRRRIDTFILLGIAAGIDAMTMAGYTPQTKEEKTRAGILFGSGIGGVKVLSETAVMLEKEPPRRISPFVIPAVLVNLIGGHLSIKYGLEGPNLSTVTACATGTHAIGEASRLIQMGVADVMIAGGSESAICPVALGGFGQARALSTHYNDTPEKASRPFDTGRDGFVMGEGAGALVLEEYEHAKARGAKIYAEIVGYGLTADAYHITAPGGDGARRCMQMALDTAGLTTKDIDYINAHGTSTPLGDALEAKTILDMFGPGMTVSSTKGHTGHLLGAAGAVEAIYGILTLQQGLVPPTANLENPLPEGEGLDLVRGAAKEKACRYVLSNSFGFGGTNGSLVLGKVD